MKAKIGGFLLGIFGLILFPFMFWFFQESIEWVQTHNWDVNIIVLIAAVGVIYGAAWVVVRLVGILRERGKRRVERLN